MGDVTIGGEQYIVYGTAPLADVYWNGRIGSLKVAWTAADPDTRASAMVMAYDVLERQAYKDEVNTFELRDVIQAFRDASYQLAAMIMVDESVYSVSTSGKNIKKVEADVGTSVEYFKDTLDETGRFPANVQELIGRYLAGATTGSVSGSYASGTTENQTSSFDPSAFGITRGT